MKIHIQVKMLKCFRKCTQNMLSCQFGEMFKPCSDDCSVLDLQYTIPSHNRKQMTVGNWDSTELWVFF